MSETHDGPPLFARVLGGDWERLPDILRAAHDVKGSLRLTGRADVRRSGNPLIDRFGTWSGLPPAGRDVPLTITMERDGEAEIWTRYFGDHVFRSRITAGHTPCTTWEKAGPLVVEMQLETNGAVIQQKSRRNRFMGLSLPNMLAPVSHVTESVVDDRYHFDVAVQAPFSLGLLVSYRGWLIPEDS